MRNFLDGAFFYFRANHRMRFRSALPKSFTLGGVAPHPTLSPGTGERGKTGGFFTERFHFRFFIGLAWIASLLIGAVPRCVFGAGGPSHVELRQALGNWQLLCDGQPFFIQGAGGDASRDLLKPQLPGGNPFRLWGADNIDGQLETANRLGLKVAVGIWLEHTGGPKHFSYHNAKQVAEQFERAKKETRFLKYKDNPAVLVWGSRQ